MQVDPASLGARIFINEPGSLGIIDAGLASRDNEIAFQILIQVALAGIATKGISLGDLIADEDIRDDFNQHLMWLGYKAEFKAISYAALSKLVYYCSFNETGNLYLNKFHPYRLMEPMPESSIPHCYQSLFDDIQHLNKVFAIRRYHGGVILIFFNRIEILQ